MGLRVQPKNATDPASPQKVLHLAREGFIPSSVAATLFGSLVSTSYIQETGGFTFLTSVPSFFFGGGTGGAVTRIAYQFLKKTNSHWISSGLSAVGGAGFGAGVGMGIHATITNSLLPTPEGNFLYIVLSTAASGATLFSFATWVVGDPATAVSLGAGAGSLAGMSLSALSLLFGENGIAVFNGAFTGGAAALFGLMNVLGTRPSEEHPLLPLTRK